MEKQNPEPLGFSESGCWVRIVWWPEDEVTRLGKREKKKLSDHSLVTFVKRGLAIPLRGTALGEEDCTEISYETNDLGDGFGFFIPAKSDEKVLWWFTGVGKKGSDVVDKMDLKDIGKVDNGSGDFHQLWNCSIQDIVSKIAAVEKDNKDLPVNEGLISYKIENIVGLLINPKSVKSVAKAAGFRDGILKRECPLFSYKLGVPTFHQLETVKQNLERRKQFEKKYFDYKDFYEVLFNEAR